MRVIKAHFTAQFFVNCFEFRRITYYIGHLTLFNLQKLFRIEFLIDE